MARKDKICLVLGGGGARGLSHLGVLQVLEREEIPIHCVVGTSVGAVVGAAYALEPDAVGASRRALAYLTGTSFRNDTFKKVLLKSENSGQNFFKNLLSGIRKSYVFSNLLRKPAIFPSGHLEAVIADLLPDKDFADTKIPFAVPALDIRSGREVLISTGPIRKAVLASCSLPGFFPPVQIDDMLLADAGVIGPVPVNAASYFDPTAIIAVDITSQIDHCTPLTRGLDAILRVEAIAGKRLNDIELARADVVIRPQVGKRYWSDFSGLDGIVSEGIAAAEQCIPELKSIVHKKRFSLF
ncbi:MAG TPA: patatin-like phospholipase family protein [Planctomycetota bacterium]|jgi:NTE family protein|nr:patatin-like phospholipase family protein [Planctomycetota bacterium]